MGRRVEVDQQMCEGHGKCQAAAPEVFEHRDEDDLSHVILAEVPDALAAKVDRAIRLCPRQAIRWVS